MLRAALADQLRLDHGETGLLAQLSPHEFASCHWETQPPFQAMPLAQRMLSRIQHPLITLGTLTLRPAASIGVAIRLSGDENAESLLRRAASAALSVAARGKNQIVFFESGQAEAEARRLTFAHTLLDGIEHGRCTLFFQPQVDMRDQRLLSISAEALRRWRQDDGSWSLAEDFICQAEAGGVMVPLGN
ncbi:hypothetical protein [Sodalis sp. (in: enterobacteria)]|uniref:hypothetical protein n=1 Tax=Sodalis sp. (in: enterobacteria) TaxID=1898979 RepID=UPI003F686DC8